MEYCTYCGRMFDNETDPCPNCGNVPIIEGEIIKEEIREVKSGFNYDAEKDFRDAGRSIENPYYKNNNSSNSNKNTTKNPANLILKIIIFALIIIIPGIGPIVGIISGIIFMGKNTLSDRKFGKLLVIEGILCLILSILYCSIKILYLPFFSSWYYY